MINVRAETGVKNGTGTVSTEQTKQFSSQRNRSQDTDSRERQEVRSTSKKQMIGRSQRQDKRGGYSGSKNILLLEAAAGLLIPGAGANPQWGLLGPGAWH